MPLPRELVAKLANGDLKSGSGSKTDYVGKIPTLDESIVPDNTPMWDVSASGSEIGRLIHRNLDQSGLTKGQRAGMSNLLQGFVKIQGNELTVGDIRALTEDELVKLSGEFDWQTPSIQSVKKVKKLLG